MRTFLPVLLSLAAAGLGRAEPNPIDFASGGFQEGPLKGQNGWVVNVQAPANADFVYTPGKGLALTNNSGGTHAASYACFLDKSVPNGRDTFLAGMPISTSVDFVLTQEAGTKKAPILGIGWGQFAPFGPSSVQFFAEFARDTASGGYRLRLVKLSDKTVIDGDAMINIPEAALGLGEGDADSDPLQLSLTLNNEGAAPDWTSICMVTNLATKKAFVLKNTVKAPGAYKTDDLVRGIVNLRRNKEDGLSSIYITKTDAEVVPDPASQ